MRENSAPVLQQNWSGLSGRAGVTQPSRREHLDSNDSSDSNDSISLLFLVPDNSFGNLTKFHQQLVHFVVNIAV